MEGSKTPAFKPVTPVSGERHHATMQVASGAHVTVQASMYPHTVRISFSALAGALFLMPLTRAEAAALGRELLAAAGADEPTGPYWIRSTVGMNRPCIVEYEPTPDGACLGPVWVDGAVLDGHADADVFTPWNTSRWQVQADLHLKQLAKDSRDDARIEAAIYDREAA